MIVYYEHVDKPALDLGYIVWSSTVPKSDDPLLITYSELNTLRDLLPPLGIEVTEVVPDETT